MPGTVPAMGARGGPCPAPSPFPARSRPARGPAVPRAMIIAVSIPAAEPPAAARSPERAHTVRAGLRGAGAGARLPAGRGVRGSPSAPGTGGRRLSPSVPQPAGSAGPCLSRGVPVGGEGSQLPSDRSPPSSHGGHPILPGDLSPSAPGFPTCPGSGSRGLSPRESRRRQTRPPCLWRGVSGPGVRDPACPRPRCLRALEVSASPSPGISPCPAVLPPDPGLEGSACPTAPVSCSSPSPSVPGVGVALGVESPKYPWDSP